MTDARFLAIANFSRHLAKREALFAFGLYQKDQADKGEPTVKDEMYEAFKEGFMGGAMIPMAMDPEYMNACIKSFEEAQRETDTDR